jgi:5-methylcytosine-specific restriction protein A
MRNEFERWTSEYPGAVALGDAAFKGSSVARFVTQDVPAAIRAAISGPTSRFTPWVALLDPAVTTTVQEGYYVVYVLSADGRRLYLTLNQGCTLLKNAIGIPRAREELTRRAANMRAKLGSLPKQLGHVSIDLGSKLWRARLYEAGAVLGVEYDTSRIPDEGRLTADLQEALTLYLAVQNEGGWAAEDELLTDAAADGLQANLTQAKRYKQHRSIERQSKHSRAVKKALGTKCMGCTRELADVYGPIGQGLIHAHHLTPLSRLADGVAVQLNPSTDFAVLCPNCHAIIHRMADVSDVAGLKALIVRDYTSELV